MTEININIPRVLIKELIDITDIKDVELSIIESIEYTIKNYNILFCSKHKNVKAIGFQSLSPFSATNVCKDCSCNQLLLMNSGDKIDEKLLYLHKY